MGNFWHDILVVPLFNVLILLYDTAAFGNLGLAVIELTLLLRLILLPLSIVDERKKAQYEKLSDEVDKIKASFKNDEIGANEQIREMMRKRGINHWAKGLVLFIQLLVLLVLYRVFITGINANMSDLYAWVPTPAGSINTNFFGFDIGERNLYWAIAVGLVLYIEIVAEQRQVIHLLGKQDAIFRYAFPIMTVVVLSLLPMVKALFILTAMAFSALTSTIRRLIWPTD